MWHLKTRLGVFWVVPVKEGKKSRFVLGVNEDELAFYTDVEEAARDVHDQNTGFLKWDSQPVVKAPVHIAEWAIGEPKMWNKN